MILRSRLASFVILVVVALCLYLPFLTRNYDLNGLAEVAAVKTGVAGALFSPNHMLYRPVAFSVQRFLTSHGFEISLLSMMQVMSAIFGALGVGFTYLMISRLVTQPMIAFWASLGLGVSWSYWTLSTDVYYFSLAAMLVAITMAIFVNGKTAFASIACGVFAGLSILACQANVFLLPGLAVAAVIYNGDLHPQELIRRILRIWGSTAALIVLVYVCVGVFVYNEGTLSDVIRWGTRYSGNLLPMWASWSPIRFALAAGSAVKSIVGMELSRFGFALRHLKNGELPTWFAPLVFPLLVAAVVVVYRMGKPNKNGNRTALWLLLMYLAYLPFNIWWEGMEPRWFIFPNIFLAGLIAVTADRWKDARYFRVALPAIVVLVGFSNFMLSAAPRRLRPTVDMQTADCVASHMKREDLFLATEWNWAGYIEYVHDRAVLNMISEVSRTGSKKAAFTEIAKAVYERQRQGGDVYMMNFEIYPPEYMQWLASQTAVTADDLRTYHGTPAFQCSYGNFIRLDRNIGIQ